MTRWSVHEIDNGAHVIPEADLVPHDLADDCACGPTSEPVPREDGSMGWLAIHHSLDGREAAEADHSARENP